MAIGYIGFVSLLVPLHPTVNIKDWCGTRTSSTIL